MLENVKAQCLCGQVEVPAEGPPLEKIRFLCHCRFACPFCFQLLSLCWSRLPSRLMRDNQFVGGDWMHNIA